MNYFHKNTHKKASFSTPLNPLWFSVPLDPPEGLIPKNGSQLCISYFY